MSNQKQCVIITAFGSTGLTRWTLNWAFRIDNQSKVRYDAPKDTGGTTTYVDQMRQLECFWLGRDPVLVLEAPNCPAWGLNLWSSQAEVKGSPPRMFLWGFSKNVSGLGQRKPVSTTDTVSSKWLQPMKTNSPISHKQNPFPAHCLQTHLPFPPPPAPLTDIVSDQWRCIGLLLIPNYLISKLTTRIIFRIW